MHGGETLELIIGELRGCGYSVRTKIFDAKGWVPQSRKRIYFVGFRDDLAGAAERFAWPMEPETCGGTVQDILEDEGEYYYGDGGDGVSGCSGVSGGGGVDAAALAAAAAAADVGGGANGGVTGSGRNVVNEAAAACEVSQYQMERSAAFFHRRDENAGGVEGVDYERHVGYLSAEDGVARTLCASYRKSSVYNAELVPPPSLLEVDDVDEGAGDEGGQRPAGRRGRGGRRQRQRRPRYYTVREAARLQGFPETFHPDPERGYHELGNAVVPPLVRSVGEAVLRALEAAAAREFADGEDESV